MAGMFQLFLALVVDWQTHPTGSVDKLVWSTTYPPHNISLLPSTPPHYGGRGGGNVGQRQQFGWLCVLATISWRFFVYLLPVLFLPLCWRRRQPPPQPCLYFLLTLVTCVALWITSPYIVLLSSCPPSPTNGRHVAVARCSSARHPMLVGAAAAHFALIVAGVDDSITTAPANYLPFSPPSGFHAASPTHAWNVVPALICRSLSNNRHVGIFSLLLLCHGGVAVTSSGVTEHVTLPP